MKTKSKMLTIRVTDEIFARIEDLKQQTGQSRSAAIAQWITFVLALTEQFGNLTQWPDLPAEQKSALLSAIEDSLPELCTPSCDTF